MIPAGCDVTIVIPTRNRAAVLPGALRSAITQAEVLLEVIVVDDGSDDKTAELVREFSDPRVRLIRNERSRGVAAARNLGAAEAGGEWLAFLDDDDLWAPTWLRSAVRIGRSSGAGAAYGARWVVDATRRVIDAWPASRASDVHGLLADFNALGGPSGVVIRADVFATAGGFDERLSALADWELWLRLLDVATAVPVADFLVAYTIYGDNMHMRNPSGYLSEFDVFSGIVAERAGGIANVNKRRFVRWLAAEVARNGRRGTAARLWLLSARLSRRPGDAARALRAWLGDEAVTEQGFAAAPCWLVSSEDAASGG